MGCSSCKKCEFIKMSAFCGKTKLTQKQLYSKNGYCSHYEPKDTNNQNKERNMDEKAERLSRIIEEDYIERLKLMASYYGQFKESPNAKYNAEALQYAIEKLEYWLNESES